LDHALGVPYVLSQRTLHRAAPTRVFCPAELVAPLAGLIRAAEAMESTTYRYELRPLAPGDRVEVGRDLAVEAFAVDHVVPTLGFHLVRTRRRLPAALAGLAPAEIIALREKGIPTSESREELWLSYCADTGPGTFDLEPRLFDSRILLLECTYLSAEHRDKGERFKHLDLGEIAERAASFRNEAVVLHHLSRRHRVAELRAEVDRRLPELAGRVHLLVETEEP
jgi:ribonuclease Z